MQIAALANQPAYTCKMVITAGFFTCTSRNAILFAVPTTGCWSLAVPLQALRAPQHCLKITLGHHTMLAAREIHSVATFAMVLESNMHLRKYGLSALLSVVPSPSPYALKAHASLLHLYVPALLLLTCVVHMLTHTSGMPLYLPRCLQGRPLVLQHRTAQLAVGVGCLCGLHQWRHYAAAICV